VQVFLQVQRSRGGADVEVQKHTCMGICAGVGACRGAFAGAEVQRCKYGGSEVLKMWCR